MMSFIFKGLWRDKSRSRLPIIVVSLGVMLTVLMHAYIQGFMGDAIEINARFNHGHMKVMTAAYAENAHQMPIDLALTGSDEIMSFLEREYPGLTWSERITFGGLVDIPDAQGETQSQGPVMGMGMRLLGERKDEVVKHGLASSIARGAMPQRAGEVLISDAFALRLGLEPGDTMTLLGSTMYGSMSFHNFILSGTLVFGVEALDRGSMIADLEDVRAALDMENASSEILGFFHTGFYDDDQARKLSAGFVPPPGSGDGEFSPVMHALSQQGHMGQYVNMSKVWSGYVSLIFIMAMSLVLWNAGLLGGLRRYGEVGVRLAIGETKLHVYKTMIYESILIGLAGSVMGTILGLFFAWLIQTYGIDISGMMQGASLMMPGEIRARITPVDFYLGFIPGVLSTVLGTLLSGIGIFKRQTSSLFKELEA